MSYNSRGEEILKVNSSSVDLAREIVLENISFFEWMNMENILISIKKEDLTLLDEVNMEVLEDYLSEFLNEDLIERKIEIINSRKEPYYRRKQIKKKKRFGIF